MHTANLLTQHAAAARQATMIVRRATPDQMMWPTPCADWNLRDLLDHMTAENRGFAVAAQGGGADPDLWVGDPNRTDPVADYLAATETLISAFAEPGVLNRSFTLPLVSRQREFPGVQAVSMQLVDSVVHAWDLARALDMPLNVDADITASVRALCVQIPDDESRRRPGAMFGPRAPYGPEASALDQVLALLGRSPDWPKVIRV